MEPFETVRELIALTFDIDPGAITPESSQAEILGWDSVGHLNLMLALEQAFSITMGVDDMPKLTSVPKILDYLRLAP